MRKPEPGDILRYRARTAMSSPDAIPDEAAYRACPAHGVRWEDQYRKPPGLGLNETHDHVAGGFLLVAATTCGD